MKLVLFSDLHLDTPFVGMGAELSRRRNQALRDTLRAIVDLTAEVGADALLCAGDLYEQRNFTPDTQEFVRATLSRAGVRVFISPGNHDWYGETSLYRLAKWPANVHIFTSASLSAVPLQDGFTLWGAAHCMPAGTAGFFDAGFRVEGPGVHLALFHGSERSWLAAQGNDKSPHAPFDEEQIAHAGIVHAFVGHYHKAKAGRYLTYAGNPCPLAFGEDSGRGAVVVTVDSQGNVEREWVSVARYEVHNLLVDLTGCASQQDIRDLVWQRLDGLRGCARVQVVGELSPEVSLEGLNGDAWTGPLDKLSISFAGVRIAYDLESIAKEPTVRGQFVRDVIAAGLPDDECQRILVTGLRALAGRSDLEVMQ